MVVGEGLVSGELVRSVRGTWVGPSRVVVGVFHGEFASTDCPKPVNKYNDSWVNKTRELVEAFGREMKRRDSKTLGNSRGKTLLRFTAEYSASSATEEACQHWTTYLLRFI